MRIRDGFCSSREELAWAAGFFDGEGHIRFSNNIRPSRPHSHSPEVLVETSQAGIDCPDVLTRFRAAIGGLCKIDGPRSNGEGHLPIWNTRTSRFEHSQAIIAMLWPWLGSVKRAAAQKALLSARSAYAETVKRRQQRYSMTRRAVWQRNRAAAILAGTWKTKQ